MSSNGVAFSSIISISTDLNLFLEGENLAGYLLFAITVVSGAWSPLQRCANYSMIEQSMDLQQTLAVGNAQGGKFSLSFLKVYRGWQEDGYQEK